MSTIHDRIIQICEYKNISLRQLANTAGVTYNSLYSSVQKKSDIGISTITKISLAVPDISCTWLLHGTGNMIEQHTDNDNINIDNFKYLVDKIEYLSGKVSTLQVLLHNASNNDESK